MMKTRKPWTSCQLSKLYLALVVAMFASGGVGAFLAISHYYWWALALLVAMFTCAVAADRVRAARQWRAFNDLRIAPSRTAEEGGAGKAE